MYIRLALSSIALLVVPCFAYASSWYITHIIDTEMAYYFDADTVEKDRDIATVWLKRVNRTAPDVSGAWATASRTQMDCKKRTIQTLSVVTYGQEGKLIGSTNYPGDVVFVAPDSIGEALLKMVCEPDFPNDKSGKEYFDLQGIDPLEATKQLNESAKGQADSAPR